MKEQVFRIVSRVPFARLGGEGMVEAYEAHGLASDYEGGQTLYVIV